MSKITDALVIVKDGSLEEISPLMARSLDLQKQAEEIIVTDTESLKQAIDIKKQITAYRKEVQDKRLEITRPINDVVSQFITKEKEITLPLDKGQTAIGEKVMEYEREQERIRREEEERVSKIVERFTVTQDQVYKLSNVDTVQDEGERFKKLYGELPDADQKLPAVKLAFTESINRLADRRQYLIEKAEREAEAARLAEISKQQDAERAELEAQRLANEKKEREIAAEKERMEREAQRKADEDAAEAARKEQEKADKTRVKTGVRMTIQFEIGNDMLVPRSLCEPSDKLIREYIQFHKEDLFKDGERTDFKVPGVKIWAEQKL